ncbi:MAG: DeoR/GlpR transcriptional regulator [Clostridia bacterium]|nr:DeoR/GlpR transcriptional regulator [Clostridia bacterium]
MLQIKRHNDIMLLLRERKEITVKELCAALFSSPATVRRDLCELEEKGLLKRSFGGAVLVEDYSNQLPRDLRYRTNIQAKKNLCARAAALIHDGDTIFVDASSTTYFLAPYLKKYKELTVVTNNPSLSLLLSEMKIHNLCTGGEMLNDSVALVGRDAERFVSRIRAHKCFFSARGYTDFISDSSRPERDIKEEMLAHAAHSVFLADASKKGKDYPYPIMSLSEIDEIIEE